MLSDLNYGSTVKLFRKKHFDTCIAGAGIAGITLALKLAEFGQSVLLLEAGGQEFASESQDLYNGKNIGIEYFDLDVTRKRYFGGSSNHWGGWCRHLDAYDFDEKDHIPYSGWPIRKVDLDPYQETTNHILDIPHRIKHDEVFSSSDGMLQHFGMAFSPPTKFNHKYFETIKSSQKIHLILNANLVDIRLDDARRRVVGFLCRSHANVNVDHLFRARQFILALGGIENPRALLNATKQVPNGIGNQHGLVGRFFAEHPHFNLGIYWRNTPPTRLASREREDILFFSPTPKLINHEKIANCGLRLKGYGRWPSKNFDFDKESLKNLVKNLSCDSEFTRKFLAFIGSKYGRCTIENFGRLRAAWEQIPNPDSRVLLSDKRDKFGLRRLELDWRWTPMERKTAKVCAMEFGKAFARGEIGRVKIADWVLNDNIPVPGLSDGEEVAGNHHMGTTRMSNNPINGVVDGNCRVFSLDNLFIGGSSVFSTGGHANPTFTIVQLALRLADHIRGLDA